MISDKERARCFITREAHFGSGQETQQQWRKFIWNVLFHLVSKSTATYVLQQSATVYLCRRFSKWLSSVSTQALNHRVRGFRNLSKIPGACMEYNTGDEMVQYFPVPSTKVIQICGSSWHESGCNIGTGSNRTHVYMNLFHCFWCTLSKLKRSGCRTLRNTPCTRYNSVII